MNAFLQPKFLSDINECASSQCDSATTECINTSGAFSCKCKPGFAPTMECRAVGDLGLINGGIPDESIIVSNSRFGYTPSVSYLLHFRIPSIPIDTLAKLIPNQSEFSRNVPEFVSESKSFIPI